MLKNTELHRRDDAEIRDAVKWATSSGTVKIQRRAGVRLEMGVVYKAISTKPRFAGSA